MATPKQEPPTQAPHPDYSDLEVVPNTHPHIGEYAQGLETNWAEHDANALPILRPPSNDGKILSPVYDGEGKIVSPTDAFGQPEVLRDDHQDPPPTPPTICGLRRKTFWILAGVAAVIVVAAAVGGGVGGSLAAKSRDNSSSPAVTSPYVNLTIASLHWIDGANISQYRIYYQPPNASQVLESTWSSDAKNWSVSSITDAGADIKPNSPLTSTAGYPHTNTSNALVKNVYYLQHVGTVVERQSPYKDQVGIWGNDNFSGLYTASGLSSLFSYWYQNFDTKLQILTVLFQELGANSLSVAKYVQNNTDDEAWQISRQSISIQDGSSIAAAPVGSRRDLRLYLGGTDGALKQYPYNIETNVLGAATSTAFNVTPHTPICVTTEDNRNYFTAATLPECAQTNTGAFITHLILFASPDRQNLTLVSWNCSSGFADQSKRIAKLLKPDRTYLGLTSTSASNLTFVDDRVYVLYDEGHGPAVEEWQVPTSGGADTTGQNGEWKLLGGVPITQ
ncbi:hypothetical protein GQ53DRAFT_792454 [Thozetella sp. PMI_491]|nr:hypothetical protein GQ53DRAFT_792454 [Thozetella sp. PMI_491]